MRNPGTEPTAPALKPVLKLNPQVMLNTRTQILRLAGPERSQGATDTGIFTRGRKLNLQASWGANAKRHCESLMCRMQRFGSSSSEGSLA